VNFLRPYVRQIVYAGSFDATAATTVAATFPLAVLGGAAIYTCVTWEPTAGLSGVSDGTAYKALPQGLINDGVNNQSAQCHVREGVLPSAYTVTATFASTVAFRRLVIIEIANQYQGISLDFDAGQHQQNPGTGANAVSSTATAVTWSGFDELILGIACRTGGGRTADATAGTGYTLEGSVDSLKVYSVESKISETIAAQTATFTLATDGATADVTTFVLAIKSGMAMPSVDWLQFGAKGLPHSALYKVDDWL